jgi:heme exporter protein A
LLALDDLACLRGGRLLFEGLTLRLGPGEAALVGGPNGSGKSSLLRIVAGLLRPASGKMVRPARPALADEAAALDERLTLGRALGFWARLDGVVPEPGMEAMGIAHLRDVPVRMLSAGQRKRAALARVVASGALLWLLDEPGNALDSDGQALLSAAMAAQRARGGAVLAASHQPLGLDDAAVVRLGE